MKRRGRVGGAEEWPLHQAVPWSVHRFVWRATPVPGVLTVFRLVRKQPWPEEGVFIADDWEPDRGARPLRTYDPVEASEEIINDLGRVDASDRNALLGFVNRWGLFDQGEPWASVPDTRRVAVDLQELAGRVRRVRQKGASVDELDDLAFDLTARVAHVHHAVTRVGRGLHLTFRVSRLADAVVARLAEIATAGEHSVPLRECAYPKCRAIFLPERRDQIYCKTAGEQKCARRAALEAHRRRERSRRQPRGQKRQMRRDGRT
jgi:hypothetical protein